MHPDVVVHLPSGPVAGYRVGDAIDVAGVLLPRVSDHTGKDLAMLPPRHKVDGGTTTTYALVTGYVPGALERAGGAKSPDGDEHRGEDRQGQQQGQQRAGHAPKIRRGRSGRQSP